MSTERAGVGASPAPVARRLGLYGPLLLALYFVAATRWGSFLLPGPPYVGDLMLAGLIGLRLWTLARHREPAPLLSRALTVPTALLLVFSLVWLAAGDYTVDALRDGAPYFYAILVLFGQSYQRITPLVAERLVYGALLFHAAWFSVAEFIPSLITVSTLGDSEVLLFGQRPDIDGTMLGVLIALALDRVMTNRSPVPSAAVAGWALTLVLLTQSRASLLGTVAALLFVLVRWIALRAKGRSLGATLPGRPVQRSLSTTAGASLVLAVLVMVPAVLTAVSGVPDALERSVNVGFDPADRGNDRDPADRGNDRERDGRGSSGDGGDGGSQGSGGGSGGRSGDGRRQPRDKDTVEDEEAALEDTGVGTFKARLAGWEEVVDWVDDSTSRFALGAGFGPHYLQLSGADVAFLGPEADPSVRAVHNFGLNTWARLGIVGLLVLVVIAVLAVAAAVRVSLREARPPILDLLASLLVVTIPVPAMLGVVLESPFGAIPYFWAVGYLSARMVELGLWRPIAFVDRLAPARPTRSE